MSDQPTQAIIDGDLMCFKAACNLDKHGIENIEERLTQDLSLWDPGVGEVTVSFSTGRRNNYRRDFWPAYKAHRDGKAGPDSLQDVIQWVKDNHNGPIDVRSRIEADDIMGIHMTEYPSVCVTKDKDLRSVPGWFWDPETGFPELVTEDEADWNHHYQWLIGDTADNIPGIYRFGDKAAKALLDGVPMGRRSEVVMNQYLDMADATVKWTSPAPMTPREEKAYTAQMARYTRALKAAKAEEAQYGGKVKCSEKRPSRPTNKHSGTRADRLEQKYGWAGGHDEAYALSQARCVRILRAGEWDYDTETPILWTP